jgi:hypothetical protein
MNAVVQEPTGWSGRKWVYAVVVVLALQVTFLAILGERKIPTDPVPQFRTTIHFADGLPTHASALEEVGDPAAFALPTWNGFSREGWLAFDRPQFKLTDWTEPPQWLAIEVDDLGSSLHQFMQSNTIPPLLIASKPLRQSPQREFPVPNVAASDRSDFLLEGELANWTLTAELPSWAHPDLLTNTVLRVVIDQHGQTLATTLLGQSGQSQADDFAVRMIRAARFQPKIGKKPKQPFASGNVIFRWHTVPATNAGTLPALLGLP